MMRSLGTGFAEIIEEWLSQNGIKTYFGEICDEMISGIELGFPGGSHGEFDYYRYKLKGSELGMFFAFYSNFTDNDLICLVTETPAKYNSSGASVQFNSDRTVEETSPKVFSLSHEGRVTVRSAISRADLFENMKVASPFTTQFLDIASVSSWPIKIGDTSDIPKLFDRLFLYCFAIENAKRSILAAPVISETYVRHEINSNKNFNMS